MATIAVTDSSFEQDVLKAAGPVVVYFWAVWCGPCKMVAPVLEEVSNELAGKVKFGKINVDENQNIAAQYGIRSIPTMMIFKDGDVVSQRVGAVSKGDMLKWVQSV